MRLSWPEYGCLIATAVASRSEDPHTKVGACALSKEGRIVSTGYNGLKSGFVVEDWMSKDENRQKKREIMIHAEANALSLIRKGDAETICLTMSPCFACSKDIVANGIKKVYYIKEYSQCCKYKEIFDFYGVHYEQLSADSLFKMKEYTKLWIH